MNNQNNQNMKELETMPKIYEDSNDKIRDIADKIVENIIKEVVKTSIKEKEEEKLEHELEEELEQIEMQYHQQKEEETIWETICNNKAGVAFGAASIFVVGINIGSIISNGCSMRTQKSLMKKILKSLNK